MLQVSAELEACRSQLQSAVSNNSSLQHELNASCDQVMLLQSELRLKGSRLEAVEQQRMEEAASHLEERGQLAQQVKQLQGEQSQTMQQLTNLQAEHTAAMAQITALQQVQQQHQQLLIEHGSLQQQVGVATANTIHASCSQ